VLCNRASGDSHPSAGQVRPRVFIVSVYPIGCVGNGKGFTGVGNWGWAWSPTTWETSGGGWCCRGRSRRAMK